MTIYTTFLSYFSFPISTPRCFKILACSILGDILIARDMIGTDDIEPIPYNVPTSELSGDNCRYAINGWTTYTPMNIEDMRIVNIALSPFAFP